MKPIEIISEKLCDGKFDGWRMETWFFITGSREGSHVVFGFTPKKDRVKIIEKAAQLGFGSEQQEVAVLTKSGKFGYLISQGLIKLHESDAGCAIQIRPLKIQDIERKHLEIEQMRLQNMIDMLQDQL